VVGEEPHRFKNANSFSISSEYIYTMLNTSFGRVSHQIQHNIHWNETINKRMKTIFQNIYKNDTKRQENIGKTIQKFIGNIKEESKT